MCVCVCVCVCVCTQAYTCTQYITLDDTGWFSVSGRYERAKYSLTWYWSSPTAQLVKNPPSIQETLVRSLGQEDPLGKGTATHSGIVAWRLWGCKESDTTETFTLFLSIMDTAAMNFSLHNFW